MKHIAVSQRIMLVDGERRDSLDQQWAILLEDHGCIIHPVPNRPSIFTEWISRVNPDGILLTGGNNLSHLASTGGEVPERDYTEKRLVNWAGKTGRPVLGVCRGCQFLAYETGALVRKVDGHVAKSHSLRLDENVFPSVNRPVRVNSFHAFGIDGRASGGIVPWAWSEDGNIEGFRYGNADVWGIMWHPERPGESSELDHAVLREVFG